MSKGKRSATSPGTKPRRDWRTNTVGPQRIATDQSDRSEDAPSMSRSRVQLATAYAPGTLFTWEGAKGICRAVPVSSPAEIKSATRLMIFEGVKEAAANWQERALSVRDADTIPSRLVLDAPFLDERTGEVVIDDARDFKLTRPDRVGYIPFPLLFRCGTCGRLLEFGSVDDQARNPLPTQCDGHRARWSQVDVVYVHWSGGLEPLSPFHYTHTPANNEVSRINKCECGSADFRLNNDSAIFSEWKFFCLGCGQSRDLKQSDPLTLALLKPRMDNGQTHQWIEIHMLPVSYRANAAYYVQKGYFIDFEDRRVVDLMMPPQRPELLRSIATMHGFDYDEPSEDVIRRELIAAGKPNDYAAWETMTKSARDLRSMGQVSNADIFERQAAQQRESWFQAKIIKRGTVRSAALASGVEARSTWARRFDPLRLTIEHDVLVREHIMQRLPTFGAVDVLDPDRLLSEAFGDASKLDGYKRTIGGLMQRIGIDRMFVIRSLPICEYSFGFSRVSSTPTYMREHGNQSFLMPVRLNAFPMLPDSPQRPVYVLEQDNEAIYVKLSQARVRAWLTVNGVTPAPYPDDQGLARIYLEQYENFGPYLDDFKGHEGRPGSTRDLCPFVYMLIHSLSHQFIHALAEMSGLDRDGIGEHIFPADLAFVIYRKGMTPDLGNISAMWRNYSEAFLQRILEPRLLRCGSGTLCDSRGGACPACIMLPDLTCIGSNQLLSRAALKGGPPPTWVDRAGPALTGFFDPALAP